MDLQRIIIFLFVIVLNFLEGNTKVNLITEKSYTCSTDALKRLLDIEEKLLENMNDYVEQLKKKLNLTLQALDNFRAEERRMSVDYEAYLGNPLNSFALIRHQQEDWPKWASYMNKSIGSEQIAYAHQMRSELPTVVDLEDASRSIELLVTFYEMHPNDLAAGTLRGHAQPDAALSELDCYAMGKFNMFLKRCTEAEAWFNASLAKFDERRMTQYKVYDFSVKGIHKWLGVLKLKRGERTAGMRHVHQAEDGHNDSVLKSFVTLETIKKHCSAVLQRPHNLHCRYNNWMTPFLTIAPLKMEELSQEPLVRLYHEAIYDSEIDWLLSKSLKFEPALLTNNFLSLIRTANNHHVEHDNVTEAIFRRITDMSGFSTWNAEGLILINYGIGGHYSLHKDAFDEMSAEKGNRIATTLFYVGDVESGGATILPQLNLTITPEKGTAILWHNLEDDGKPHPKSEHAACPVIVGSKYVLTAWINDMEQMFIKPCPANFSSSAANISFD